MGFRLLSATEFLKRETELCETKNHLLCGNVMMTGGCDFEKRIPGTNFPPMHPNCRCAFEVMIDFPSGSEDISSKLEAPET